MFVSMRNPNHSICKNVLLFCGILVVYSIIIPRLAAVFGDENGARFVVPSFASQGANKNVSNKGSFSPSTPSGIEEAISTGEESEEEDALAEANIDVTLGEKGDSSLHAPYDVFKENGHYFVDWDDPDVVLVFTGMTNGYIEPCGCAGMDRMKGGLSRRQSFLKTLRNEKDWNVVAIDTGQITTGFGVQEELKFDMAMNAFQIMQYDAIGIGEGELRFPAYFLLTYTTPTSSSTPSLFTSANIGVYGYHPTYTLPYKIIERGGKKICITSVVSNRDQQGNLDENILYSSPEKKLSELEKERRFVRFLRSNRSWL